MTPPAADADSIEVDDATLDPADAGRRLFSYLGSSEWRDYRAILHVFAGTFFAEFTPEDVSARLAETGTVLDGALVRERLERLSRWGNLTVSTSIGNPSSLVDYYRRRNRYLITSTGQDVYEVVEDVLGRVDEVQDVSASRLRTLLDALRALRDLPIETTDPELLADRVREVFQPHEDFTTEITRFFASLNQWQSRYDLSHDELTFFAQVLVTYVAEQLDEIQRVAGPITLVLEELMPRVPSIVGRASRGLADRVEAAGVANHFTVAHRAGTDPADWDHLQSWFCPTTSRPARLTQLRSDAIAAIRTLTLNLTRLSNIGVGGASRRADLIRFAALLDHSTPAAAPRLVQAAFGLGPSVHWGTPADDLDDPVSATTPWAEAPPAQVPVSMRERGNRTAGGGSSPLPDRSAERRLLAHRRQTQRDAIRLIDDELVSVELDGATISPDALHRLQGLVGASLARMVPGHNEVEHADGQLRCRVRREADSQVRLSTVEGTLTFDGLTLAVDRVEGPS